MVKWFDLDFMMFFNKRHALSSLLLQQKRGNNSMSGDSASQLRYFLMKSLAYSATKILLNLSSANYEELNYHNNNNKVEQHEREHDEHEEVQNHHKQQQQPQLDKIKHKSKKHDDDDDDDDEHDETRNALVSIEMKFISLCSFIILNQIFSLSAYFVDSLPTILISLIIALASFGASFGLRKMYVKALLKIFEYATNIKQEKIKDCEELLEDDVNKNERERRKQLAKLARLRHESFLLNPPSAASSNIIEQQTTRDDIDIYDIDRDDSSSTSSSNNNNNDEESDDQLLNDTDKQNNNYLAGSTKKRGSISRSKSDATQRRTKSKTTTKKIKNVDYEDDDAEMFIELSNKKKNSITAANNGANRLRSISDIRRDFQLGDVIDFVHNGVQSIIDDDVTKRFTTEELTVWNLLSRTNQQYEYVSFRVTVLWMLGLVLRYLILFPFRLILFILACFYTFVSAFLIGLINDGPFKRWLNWYASLFLHRILSRVFSAIITFHNREHKAKSGSICVANHTSPIDVIILSTDNCYAMIGQEHGGFTGMMQKAFSRSGRHIWFDRSEAKDRSLVAKRMRDHVQEPSSLPILIFPEGTCINNTSVMMFKKGCFEVDTVIYPVAIKYDLRFGDAFWNSSKHTMLQYLILMMTSWAIVVDVYYLPPMEKQPGEDATQFASRVKSEIVKKGSFVDLNWDGMLKRTAPKLDLMYEQQQRYVSQLKLE